MFGRMSTTALSLFCASLFLGCGSGAGPEGTGGLAVVDLDQVAAELGRDAKIKEALLRREAELNQQFNLVGRGGFPLSESDRLRVRQEMAAFRRTLINDFRNEIKPIAQKIASERGLSIVVPKNEGLLLSFEPGVEITSAVVDEMRRNTPPAQISNAGGESQRN